MTNYLTNSNLLSRRKRKKNNSKPKEVNLIQSLVGIISILLSCHYYLSFRWLNGFLDYYGIDSLAIITVEDVTFRFGNLNMTVIFLSSLGFLWIYGWKLASSRADYDNAGRNLIDGWKNVKDIWTHSTVKSKLIFLFIMVIVVFSYIFIFKPELEYPNSKFEWLYFVIFLAIPFAYILNTQKRPLIMGFYIFCMFVWANAFVSESIKGLSNSSEKSKNVIPSVLSFEYEGKPITTSDSLHCIYFGYKFLVLAKPNKNYQLFKTNKMKHIEYQPKKDGDKRSN